jgi:putative RecB family exonuclease
MVVFSHSRLSTFESCPLQFKFRYIDEEKPYFDNTIEAFMGSRVHDTLEKLYTDIKYQKLNTVEECLIFFNEKWDELWTDNIKIVKEDYSIENYKKMGEKFITDYYKRFYPFNQHIHIDCEKRILIDLSSDVQIQGFIDRLSCDKEGTYYIHDYKTANTLPTQDYADSDRQLALYAIAVKELYKDCKKVKLVWHYLAFDKDVYSERTDEQLENLKKETLELITKINNTSDFPANQSALCGWCGYRHICPHFKHLYELEKNLENPYYEDDGVTLVEKYILAKKKEDEAKKEIEQIKDAIIMYAERKKMLTLFSKKNKVRIWEKECIKFPGKNDPILIEIKKLLKSVGKYDDISIIDTWELSKIMEDKLWPDHILDMLKNFAKKEKIQRLYTSEIK